MSGREMSPGEQALRYEIAVWNDAAESYPMLTGREMMMIEKRQADVLRKKRAEREQKGAGS